MARHFHLDRILALLIAANVGLLIFQFSGIDSSSENSTAPHFIDDIPLKNQANLVNVVVEIPTGTNAKWEVSKQTGKMIWDTKSGKKRIIQYLSYPGNYGMIPQTLLPKEQGGDGDPLDVLVLGPAVSRGTVLPAKLIGVLKLLDNGEQDDKLIAVTPGGPLSRASNVDDLEANYKGVKDIIEIWFENYKGPGEMKKLGFEGAKEAQKILDDAAKAYKKAQN